MPQVKASFSSYKGEKATFFSRSAHLILVHVATRALYKSTSFLKNYIFMGVKAVRFFIILISFHLEQNCFICMSSSEFNYKSQGFVQLVHKWMGHFQSIDPSMFIVEHINFKPHILNRLNYCRTSSQNGNHFKCLRAHLRCAKVITLTINRRGRFIVGRSRERQEYFCIYSFTFWTF